MNAAPSPPYGCEDDARRALIATARAMNAAGLNHGKAGNVSLRWPRSGADGFLITPSALPYDRLAVDDVVWVRFGGEADGRRRPSSEWRFHHDILAARPDSGCVLHTHGAKSAALACTARVQAEGMPAFHYMIAVAGGATIRCAPYAPFGTQALSDLALKALQGRRACLLANHGLVVVGGGLDEALALATDVEALAAMYVDLLVLGDAVVLSDEAMADVQRRFADYRSDPTTGSTASPNDPLLVDR